MDWTKVVTDPLGFASFGLALVFSVVAAVVRKRAGGPRWIVAAGFVLAGVCIVGGLAIAYRLLEVHAPNTQNVGGSPTLPAAPSGPAMHINKIEQKAEGGAAVAGVQGNVTVNAPARQKEPKPKP